MVDDTSALKIAQAKLSSRNSTKLKVLFNYFDKDSNGSISAKEAKKLLKKLSGKKPSSEDVTEFLAFVDKDNNGITFEELEKFSRMHDSFDTDHSQSFFADRNTNNEETLDDLSDVSRFFLKNARRERRSSGRLKRVFRRNSKVEF